MTRIEDNCRATASLLFSVTTGPDSGHIRAWVLDLGRTATLADAVLDYSTADGTWVPQEAFTLCDIQLRTSRRRSNKGIF